MHRGRQASIQVLLKPRAQLDPGRKSRVEKMPGIDPLKLLAVLKVQLPLLLLER